MRMGSAPAVTAAVPYPGTVTQVRRPEFPARDNEVQQQQALTGAGGQVRHKLLVSLVVPDIPAFLPTRVEGEWGGGQVPRQTGYIARHQVRRLFLRARQKRSLGSVQLSTHWKRRGTPFRQLHTLWKLIRTFFRQLHTLWKWIRTFFRQVHTRLKMNRNLFQAVAHTLKMKRNFLQTAAHTLKKNRNLFQTVPHWNRRGTSFKQLHTLWKRRKPSWVLRPYWVLYSWGLLLLRSVQLHTLWNCAASCIHSEKDEEPPWGLCSCTRPEKKVPAGGLCSCIHFQKKKNLHEVRSVTAEWQLMVTWHSSAQDDWKLRRFRPCCDLNRHLKRRRRLNGRKTSLEKRISPLRLVNLHGI